MASIRDIKRRKATILSTEQITKAMKLVSTAKLQKARTRVEEYRPYAKGMRGMVDSVLRASGRLEHRYLESNGSKRVAVIAITSNRGLAGGYSNNVVRLVSEDNRFPAGDTEVIALGRKGRDHFSRMGYEVKEDSGILDHLQFSAVSEMAVRLLKEYEEAKIRELWLAYTLFKNTVVQVPSLIRLLPLDRGEEGLEGRALMNYEPEEDEILDRIIPEYAASLIYGALLESSASEHGARMNAMDTAAGNARDMIEQLELEFNRARQGAVTQELTEIIAGAGAI